jgi:hypothetical protein
MKIQDKTQMREKKERKAEIKNKYEMKTGIRK